MSRLRSSHSYRDPGDTATARALPSARVSQAVLGLAAAAAVTLPLLPADVAQAGSATPRAPAAVPKAIERLTPYVGQRYCDPVARPGVSAFRTAVLRTYPNTGDFGIVRDCGIGGISEHKEGRAWDWRVNAAIPSQRAAAEALLGWLIAADSAGNPAAMARRLGVMYIIWNGRMWRSYQASAGWLPHHGAAHSDHVHFSFSWEGALRETSFHSGRVAAHRPKPPWPMPLWQPNPNPASAAPARAPRSSGAAGYPGYPLKPGATGAAVTAVQRALGIPADGKYGPGTDAAVVRWQTTHKLTPDGDVGPHTWKAIFSSGPALTPVASRKAVSTLLYGSRGEAVRTLQSTLGIQASGWFGPLTRNAVLAYQRSHGLVADGMAGPQTRAALGV